MEIETATLQVVGQEECQGIVLLRKLSWKAEVNEDDKKLVEDLLKSLDDGTKNVTAKLENDEEVRGRNEVRCC